MTAPIFMTAPIPDDDAPEWLEATETADLECVVCGTPLTYGGRGPKPKFCIDHKTNKSTSNRSSGARISSDVNAAMSTLSALYDAVAMGLMLVSPTAAQVWAGQIESLQEKNKVILTADKDLCRMINRGAASGGRYAFVAAHAAALTPPLIIAVRERKATVAAKAAERMVDVDATEYGL